MQGKQLLWHEAVSESHAPKHMNGMVRVGWLWRNPAGKVQWFFTKILTARSYPPGSVFVAVYVPEK